MQDKKRYKCPLFLITYLSLKDVLDSSKPIDEGNDFISDKDYEGWN